MFYLASLLLGAVAGLRAMIAVAAVSWAARLGLFSLGGTWLAFLGYRWTPIILTIAVIGELVSDKLAATPSRLVPQQFGARIVMGALSGAAVGAGASLWIGGLVLGILGAVIGTLVGSRLRLALASVFQRDLPAAILEDIIALGGAALIVFALI